MATFERLRAACIEHGVTVLYHERGRDDFSQKPEYYVTLNGEHLENIWTWGTSPALEALCWIMVDCADYDDNERWRVMNPDAQANYDPEYWAVIQKWRAKVRGLVSREAYNALKDAALDDHYEL